MSPSPLAWVLHSPRRLTAVLAVGIALVVALTMWGGGQGSGSDIERHVDQQDPVVEAQAVPSSSAGAAEHGDGEAKSIGPAARVVVEQFLELYLAPTSRDQLEQLGSLCTSHLWAGLAVADPANMPDGPVQEIEMNADGAFTAAFAVKLPEDSLSVEVVLEPGGLRVASVEPETP